MKKDGRTSFFMQVFVYTRLFHDNRKAIVHVFGVSFVFEIQRNQVTPDRNIMF